MNPDTIDALLQERAIERLILSVGYVLDTHDYSRIGEVFADDIDFANPGRLEAKGVQEVIAAFNNIADPARSHHTTNVRVTLISETEAECTSKAITVRADGAIAPAEYTDTVRLTEAGWRVSRRRIRSL